MRSVVRLATVAALAAVLAPACSLGSGTGTCSGTLDVPDCWSGAFNLHPDFFAAVPGATPEYPQTSNDALQIRIQHGGDYETFSDGIIILVDSAAQVRGLLGQSLVVSLPPSVVPTGVPITPVSSPRVVSAALYLDNTCRTQDDALYAMDAVSGVDPDGECRAGEGGAAPPLACPAPATAVPGPDGGPLSGDGGVVYADAGAAAAITGAIGTSTITFHDLFDGNPDEPNASERLSDADFDFYFADPRNICPGGLGPPPRCEGHLQGSFKFYFQRGRPAQPFP
ncbi:MAG TPA: hypothetical protein VHS09_00015 [Polyangiaceae bacterium]|nr:hypothetical protein [Polyangiaceae bacterium]